MIRNRWLANPVVVLQAREQFSPRSTIPPVGSQGLGGAELNLSVSLQAGVDCATLLE
jgi:hypothetical protein